MVMIHFNMEKERSASFALRLNGFANGPMKDLDRANFRNRKPRRRSAGLFSTGSCLIQCTGHLLGNQYYLFDDKQNCSIPTESTINMVAGGNGCPLLRMMGSNGITGLPNILGTHNENGKSNSNEKLNGNLATFLFRDEDHAVLNQLQIDRRPHPHFHHRHRVRKKGNGGVKPAMLNQEKKMEKHRALFYTKSIVSRKLLEYWTSQSRKLRPLIEACKNGEFIEEDASNLIGSTAMNLPHGVPILVVQSISKNVLHIHVAFVFAHPFYRRHVFWLRSTDFVSLNSSNLLYATNRLIRLRDGSSIKFSVDRDNIDKLLKNFQKAVFIDRKAPKDLVKRLCVISQLPGKTERVAAVKQLDTTHGGKVLKIFQRSRKIFWHQGDRKRLPVCGRIPWKKKRLHQRLEGRSSMRKLLKKLPIHAASYFRGKFSSFHESVQLCSNSKSVITECCINSVDLSYPLPTVLLMRNGDIAKQVESAIRDGSHHSGKPIFR